MFALACPASASDSVDFRHALPADPADPLGVTAWERLEQVRSGLPPSAGSPARVPLRREEALLTDRPFVPTDTPSLDGSPVDQVIVTTEQLAAEFQLLADRETRRGIPTVVRTVEWIEARTRGMDRAARIRTFLRDAHDLWGTEYVVLGADAEDIPPRYVPGLDLEIATDLYYACLDREWNEDGDSRFAEPIGLGQYDGHVEDVAVAPDGRLWVATRFGVAVLDAGTFVSTWSEADGLPADDVRQIDVAADGTVWISTIGGPARFDGVAWTSWSVEFPPAVEALSVVAVSGDEAWVGLNDGLARFSGGSWQHWSTGDGLPGSSVMDLARDGATLWIATPQGAAEFDGTTFTSYGTDDGLLSNWATSVEVAADGRVWVGHEDNFFVDGGLSVREGATWSSDPLAAWGGLAVRAIAAGPAPGEIWAATSAGLFHRAGTGDELLTTADGLATDDTRSVRRTPTGLAVATLAGLDLGGPGAWQNHGPADGLPTSPSGHDDIDLRPDLRIGRIPASDPAEVATYRQKLAAYQDGAASDHGDRVLLLGEDLFGPGDGKAYCLDAKAQFPPGFQFTELYEVDGNETAATAAAALAEGPGWVVHVGHGSYDAMGVGPDLELLFNRDLDAVDAAGRAAFVVVYSCNSGGFDFESSSEHLLFDPDAGAVAVLANTRAATPSVDALLNEALFAEIFGSSHAQPVRAMDTVREAFLTADEVAFQAETWWRRMYLSRSMLGAPTLATWRGTPGTLVVAHPAAVPARRAPFAVVVSEAGEGVPVAGALVCLSKGTEDYARGTTDAAGLVTFDFRPETPGSVEIVVTAPDFLPYESAVPVDAAAGPNPVADGWQPVAARTRGAAPELEFVLGVRNVGLAGGIGWDVQVTCVDPAVTVVDGVGTLGPLAAGELGWTSPFRVALDPGLPDGAAFEIHLAGAGPDSFDESYRLTVQSPGLEWAGLQVSGGTLHPVLANVGSVPTAPLTATLEGIDPEAGVIDGTGAGAAIGVGATVSLADGFEVTGPADARFRITVTDANGRTLVREIDRTAPAGVSGLAAEPQDGGALLTWEPSPSPDVLGYRVLARTGGGWEDAVGGMLPQGALAEVEVAPGGSREFAVIALDGALHASPDTARVVAHAAPPTLPGWPRKLASLVGPSPVMTSDLDGDGEREILLGSMWEMNGVHVFRADGTEWTDADLDPDTDGLFGATEERIHAAPLAVDIDGDGAKEIFAASLDGAVYGWRSDGVLGQGAPSPLPGWPLFHTERGVRSAPVAGDLDADGDLEIVTFANDGLARAFESDGTPVAGWPRATGGLGSGSTPAVLDLDGDQRADVVFGGTDSLLYVVSGDGTDFPGFPLAVGAKILSSPVLLDADGDGTLEIFVMARDGNVWAVRLDGTSLPGWPVAVEPYEFTPPSPAVADLDQDGTPEILVPGGEHLYVLRTDGSAFPGFPHSFGAGVKAVSSPVVADLDGDGSLDVLVGSTDLRLHALTLDGLEVPGWPRTFREMPGSTPFVSDVDGDGDLDVALGADDLYVRVVDVPGPALPGSAPWPGYHGGEELTGVYLAPPLLPTGGGEPEVAPAGVLLELRPAVPNPFRAATELRFALPADGRVRLEVFDVAGRRVATPIPDRILPAGAHAVRWDGRDSAGRPVATGVYFLRLQGASGARTGKILRIR